MNLIYKAYIDKNHSPNKMEVEEYELIEEKQSNGDKNETRWITIRHQDTEFLIFYSPYKVDMHSDCDNEYETWGKDKMKCIKTIQEKIENDIEILREKIKCLTEEKEIVYEFLK